jgi:hypothetical protein
LASLWSLTQAFLVSRPQSADSSHELSVPTAHQGSKVHLTRVQPPATFRLQGLITLLTVSSLRTRAGFLSHRQRSWDLPFGAFSSRQATRLLPPADPTYRSTCRCSRRRSEGPAQQASVPGIRPPESSWRFAGGLTRRPLDAPLGFALPGFSCRSPCPGFRPNSSHALSRTNGYPPIRRRPRVSINSRLARSAVTPEDVPSASNNPLRVPAPASFRYVQAKTPPGYVFASHSGLHYCRSALCSLGVPLSSTGVAGIG